MNRSIARQAILIAFLGVLIIVLVSQFYSIHGIDKVILIGKKRKLILGSIDAVRIVVLIDNYPLEGSNLISTWGLSIYIELENTSILFDTGPSPHILEHNMRVLGIDPTRISYVVLSHEHGDHVGGLKYICECNRNAKVIVPMHISQSIKNLVKEHGLDLIEVSKPMKITRGIGVTGELYGPPHEISLLINVTGKGLILVVGCSHPGIEHITEYVHNLTGEHIFMIIGGFHLTGASIDRLSRIVRVMCDYNIERVYPIHCTGDFARNFFARELGLRYCDGHVGLEVVIRG